MRYNYLFPIIACCAFLLASCTDKSSLDGHGENVKTEVFLGQQISFNEIWAYLHDGEESNLTNKLPVSDVGYFGAQINNYGRLSAVPDARKLDFFEGRVHLVVVNNHAGMTHMVLSPNYPFRNALINDLVDAVATSGYDGLQIDFELVLASDKENFLTFLAELSDRLSGFETFNTTSNGKNTQKGAKPVFSVAVPARTRFLRDDAYDYEVIAAIADSVFVMAYDEHWSSSNSGPVASFDWGNNVAKYALKTVGTEKLVMGQPFYGRTWGDVQPNRAFFHSGMERQIREFNVEKLERVEGILRFTYTVPLTITGYFDDVHSIVERSQTYKDMGIESTGFWCLGQEDPAVWQQLKIN